MDKFEKSVDNALKKCNFSNATIKLYKSNIMRVYKGLDCNKSLLIFVKNIDAIEGFINMKYSTNSSRRNYYNSIYKIIENNNKVSRVLKNKYLNFRNKYTDDYENERKDNTVDKPLMSLKELKNIPKLDFLNKQQYCTLNVDDKNKYNKKITDNFFIYIHTNKVPMRLDFYNIPLIYSKEKQPVDTNHILIEPEKITLYLYDYKTKKTYGTIKQDIINDNYKVIKQWIDMFKIMTGNNPDYLLYNYSKNKFEIFNSKKVFGIHLTKLFKKYANTNITINTIRKIWETEFFKSNNYKNLTNAERDKFHNLLLHSGSTARASYEKIFKNTNEINAQGIDYNEMI